MAEERVEAYAKLIVERCLDVQPGWQVLVVSSPVARPLVEEVVGAIARRGAYPLVRLSFVEESIPFETVWAREAPDELLGELAGVERLTREQIDAYLVIGAPENTREGSDVSPERRLLLRRAGAGFLRRRLSLELPWTGCRYPTPALAQEAGMSMHEYEDFVYGACLLDWDAEGARMRQLADRFDRADEVRIVGAGTDLTVSIAGRRGQVDDGHYNMPGGEFFYSPLEDSAEGVVELSEFPTAYQGRTVDGVRLRFERGRVVDLSARSNEDFLIATLDADEGARRLGELGIGCNPGIQRHTRDTLFDEKIDGTVHLAVGAGFPFLGGTNESSVHWDMVKDLRTGGRIFCDGELVQEDGRWLV